MARVEQLIELVKDPALRAEIALEVAALKGRQQFGLVYERHIPESTLLLNAPVRVGSTVVKKKDPKSVPYSVLEVTQELIVMVPTNPEGVTDASMATPETVNRAEILVKKAFDETIYPALTSVGRVERGGTKPYHSVINGENFHALELLVFALEGQVDCIYIDPPYNTGAKDWKYNNDYVDGKDGYRHSKWLSFMEKRLRLAKRLLKPDDGVLIVTIDENEAARLTLLLEQVFTSHEVVAVHIVHNPRGVQGDNFSAIHETALFVTPRGAQLVLPRALSEEEIREGTSPLRNWGGESKREDGANCFFPIFVKDGAIIGFGEVVDRDNTLHPKHNEKNKGGVIAVWPVDSKGVERKWRYARQTIESIRHLLVVRTLQAGAMKGDLEIEIAKEEGKQKTIWAESRYDASTHGSQLVGKLIDRSFPYPKSLYAVYDCLNVIIANRADALVLDFFAGSGTTAHAVFALNSKDGGQRRSISITNNEVGPESEKMLSGRGLGPGDPEWEALGIFEHITRPRLEAAVTGHRPDGEQVKGDYLLPKIVPMAEGFEENVEFLRLDYLDPLEVELGKQFSELVPALWLAAGGRGKRQGLDLAADFSVASDGTYAFLIRPSGVEGLLSVLKDRADVRYVFVLTDSEDAFAELAEQLPKDLAVRMLPRDYLRSFPSTRESAG